MATPGSNTELIQILNELKKLNQSILKNSTTSTNHNTTQRAATGQAGTASNKKMSDFDKKLDAAAKSAINAQDKVTKEAGKLLGKSASQLGDEMRALRKELGDLGTGTHLINTDFKKISAAQSAFLKSVMEHGELTNHSVDMMTKRMREVMTAQHATVKGLVDSMESTADVEKQYQQFSRMLESYNNALEHTQSVNITDLKIGSKDLRDTLNLLAKGLEGSNKEMSDELATMSKNYKNLTDAQLQELDLKFKAIAKMRDQVAKIAEYTASVDAVRKTIVKSVTDFVDKLPISKMATFAGSFALFIDGVAKLYNQLNTVAQAGLVNNFLSISKNSFQLGISVDSLTKIIASNKAAFNALGEGSDGFIKSLTNSQASLMSLGLSAEQAAKFQASMISTSGDMGLNIKDTKQLSTVINAQVDAFKALRATTGITEDQFVSLNKSLLESSGVQRTLLGMNQQQKTVYLQGIAAQQQLFAQYQLSADQQRRLIQAQESMQNQKLTDRLESAAKVLQAASFMGMDGSQAYNTILKGRRATTDEKSQTDTFMGDLRQRLAQTSFGGFGDELLGDTLDENMSVPAKELMEAAQALKQAAEAQKVLSPDALSKAMETGVSEPLGYLNRTLSILEQGINSPLLKILAGMAGMGIALFKINRTLSAIERNTAKGLMEDTLGMLGGDGKKGRLGKLGGKFEGAFGKLGPKVLSIGEMGFGVAKSLFKAVPLLSSLFTVFQDIKESSGGLGLLATGVAALSGPVGWLDMAASGIIGSVKSWMNAGEIFDTQVPTLGQEISAAVGGFVSGVTFGTVSMEDAAKKIYGWANDIGDMFKPIVNAITTGWDWLTKTWSNTIIPGIKSGMINLLKGLVGVVTYPFKTMLSLAGNLAGMLPGDMGKSIQVGLGDASNFLDAISTPTASPLTTDAIGTPSLSTGASSLSTVANQVTAQTSTAPQQATTQKVSQSAPNEKLANTTTINNVSTGTRTVDDLYNQLSELISVFKQSTSLSAEQLSALQKIGNNIKTDKFGMSTAAHYLTQ